MNELFYKIVDTRTGLTAYVPDYAWKRTRKLYCVMDIGDLAFMERADDEVYIKTAQGYIPENEALEAGENEVNETLGQSVSTLTIGELMYIIYEGCKAALGDFENEAYGEDFENDEPPGPAHSDYPKQRKG